MPTSGAGHLQKVAPRLEPAHGAATLGNGAVVVLLAASSAACLLLNAGAWPAGRPRPPVPVPVPELVIAVLAVVAGLAAVFALRSGRRWWTYRRIVRLMADPRVRAVLPAVEAEPTGPFAPPQPPPVVRFEKARPQWVRPRYRVTRDRNVVGLPPLQIVYLRVFESGTRARTLVDGAWREFGHVHVLRSAAAVGPGRFRAAVRDGRISELVLDSETRFRARLAPPTAEPQPPGWHRLRTVAGAAVTTYDRYGAYPVSAPICAGGFWSRGMDILLRERADLVVLDLSGYREHVHGTQVELQRVVDTVPVEKVLLLVDPGTRTRFLDDQVRLAWSRMAAGSPNVGRGRLVIRGAVTDRLVRTRDRRASNSAFGLRSSRVELRASRRQVRWLLRDVQRQRVLRPVEIPQQASGQTPHVVGTGTPVGAVPPRY